MHSIFSSQRRWPTSNYSDCSVVLLARLLNCRKIALMARCSLFERSMLGLYSTSLICHSANRINVNANESSMQAEPPSERTPLSVYSVLTHQLTAAWLSLVQRIHIADLLPFKAHRYLYSYVVLWVKAEFSSATGAIQSSRMPRNSSNLHSCRTSNIACVLSNVVHVRKARKVHESSFACLCLDGSIAARWSHPKAHTTVLDTSGTDGNARVFSLFVSVAVEM